MPGMNNYSPSAGKGGDYYCDANYGNDQWCPEYDTYEGNKHTFATSLHTCDGDSNNWWQCDRGGCQTNAFNADRNGYCPEDHCKINTSKPYTISHSSGVDGNNRMNNVNNWLHQGNNTFDFNVCGKGDYMAKMGEQIEGGMVFAASLWGGPDINMDWLDGMTGCSGTCNMDNSSVSFSDFRLEKSTSADEFEFLQQ